MSDLLHHFETAVCLVVSRGASRSSPPEEIMYSGSLRGIAGWVKVKSEAFTNEERSCESQGVESCNVKYEDRWRRAVQATYAQGEDRERTGMRRPEPSMRQRPAGLKIFAHKTRARRFPSFAKHRNSMTQLGFERI